MIDNQLIFKEWSRRWTCFSEFGNCLIINWLDGAYLSRPYRQVADNKAAKGLKSL
jgi:hypothetical protein